MARRGITIRGKSAKLGRLSTQAVRTIVRSENRKDKEGSFKNGSNKHAATTTATISLRDSASTTRNNPVLTGSAALFIRPITSSITRLPLSSNITSVIPRFRFQVPLLYKKQEKYTEDILDVSETRIKNNQFEPVEKNGISVFRPEIISIIDFMPVWKGSKPLTYKRLTRGFSPAGKLIDIQYNSLWLRRDTLVNLLNGIQRANGENSKDIFSRLRGDYSTEIRRIKKTVGQYTTFLKQAERIKSSLDIRTIPRSAFNDSFLPIADFFNSRMQIDDEEFATYSDTKILMQLLFDYKSILEGYSYNLLDLSDVDRINDKSPITIDRTYTLQDGFTFSVDQLRSKTSPINAAERSFFNAFLNSLPNNPDDRIKLLTTVLSKELRVSKGLGKEGNKKLLQEKFGAGDSGSPFDNIIGIPGNTIFDSPEGPNSLQSTLLVSINDSMSVLPFEKKYVDFSGIQKSFIPGASFFIDSAFELTSNKTNGKTNGTNEELNFNTKPFTDYVEMYTKKFNRAKQVVESLFEIGTPPTELSPERMIDSILLSFKRSVENTATTTGLSREQAIIAALFALSNKDNQLKSLLFQFCLLAGIAANNANDKKPIFTNLAKELKSIRSFPNIQPGKVRNPNLFSGLKTLRPYLSRLALAIEDRVFALTTITPRASLGITLSSSPDFNRFLTRATDKTNKKSAFDNLSIRSLAFGETTINVSKTNIKNALLVNVSSKSSSTPTIIKEFIDLSTRFSNAAAVNGERAFLLADDSGRTRFNFISTSSILLMLFEVMSSFVEKYSFSEFGKSQTPYSAFVTINAKTNSYIRDTIEDIVSLQPLGSTSSSAVAPLNNYIPITTKISSGSSFKRLSKSAQATIRRSRESSRSAGRTSSIGGLLSNLRQGDETSIVNQNIDSPFLGKGVLGRLGINKITDLSFSLRATNLRRSLISIRSKIIDEKKIKENIINILSVVGEQLKDGERNFINSFNPKILSEFLKDNSIDALEIIRNPAQVRLAKSLLDDFVQKRVSGVTERRGEESIGQFTGARRIYEEKSNMAQNFLIDEEVIFPETREALLSLTADNIFLPSNLADIRTKVLTVGVPAGFVKQLTDRVNQESINDTSFKDKQFDVISINIYKRDARFDDIVFKPQSFLFDLSLFENTDYRKMQITQNENFDRILQRIKIKDYENFDFEGPIRSRTIEDIIKDDKYNFITNPQKREIVRNHVVSGLMALYIRLLTGLRMEESTFLLKEIPPGSEFNQNFSNLIFTYLQETLNKQIAKKPISELLLDPAIDDETKDILRLLTFGNSIFEPGQLRNAVTSPKLFDRIFTIPFNTEEFEIDTELTAETESGQATMSQIFVQERIHKIGDKLFFKPKDRNELTFEDFFITIENDI